MIRLITILFLSQPVAAEEAANEVLIRGERKASDEADLPGRGLVLTPKASTQQDLNTLLANESSVDFVETGKISGSGFSVPRLRGQDSRSTEIWIDDFLVQDPLSGLPLVDEIDLRAFGTVKLLRGITPLSVHTAHQRGMIQFIPDFSGSKLIRHAGISYGRPHGTSGFGLITHPRPKSGPAYRIFVRSHVTRGEYPYYNDYATPYYTADDVISTRENNHRQASMLAPFLKWSDGRNVLKLSGILARSENGVPARNPHLKSYATEDNEQTLFNAGYSYHLDSTPAFIPSYLRLTSHLHAGLNRIRNQNADQFGYSGDREIARRGAGTKGAAHWDFSHGVAEIALADQLTKITLDDAAEPAVTASRAVTSAFAGADLMLPAGFRFFQKLHVLRNTDRISDAWTRDQAFNEARGLTKSGQATLSALAWSHGQVTTYVQHGQSTTLPSLLENFGDGGRIRPSLSLRPQRETHQETGLTFGREDWLRFGGSVFKDQTHDRIVFLPSISETSRAANLTKTTVRGYELHMDLRGAWLESALTWTVMHPESLLADGDRKKIPGIAAKQGAASVSVHLSPTLVKWQTRYRGAVWRDEDNIIQIPESVMHDLYLDVLTPFPPGEFRAGLSVLNIFDIRRSEIEASEHPDGKGATAVSDLGGYPLPGRQLKATLEYLW